ncbi:DUF1127 domain-containing protein [Roseibium sp.]|uniref:DUF1127 domain-containing protein n=1 Tax=Roseibium sp. TaxID=1936156 RepID=UPI003BA9E5FF
MAKSSEIYPAWHAAEHKTWLFIWLARFRAWRKLRQDRLELASLGDAALKDLAIDRSEIPSIIHAGEKERRRNHAT